MSNKGVNTNNIILVENNEIIRQEERIANIMNNYFTKITTHLEYFHSKSSLKFINVSKLDVKKDLSSKEATTKGDIPAKILKNSINTYLSKLTILISN